MQFDVRQALACRAVGKLKFVGHLSRYSNAVHQNRSGGGDLRQLFGYQVALPYGRASDTPLKTSTRKIEACFDLAG
jgi:hypothetical protein